MFTAAVTEPSETSDGLITIQPHVEITHAQRSSANRPRGSEVYVPVSLDHEEFRDMEIKPGGIIDKIIENQRPNDWIEIQMDNASPHVGKDTVQYLNGTLEELNICGSYILQPPNSPDMNILDLAIFNSLQKNADKLKRGCTTVKELVAVHIAFQTYNPRNLTVAYAHLNACYNEVLKSKVPTSMRVLIKNAAQKLEKENQWIWLKSILPNIIVKKMSSSHILEDSD